MKKITFSLFLSLCFCLGTAQQMQYNIGFEPSDNDGQINYWNTFESPNPIAQIIDNPDTDGGTVPVTKVLQLQIDQGSACYAGAINAHGVLGSWQLDPNVASNVTLSMSINSSLPIGRVGVKMVNSTDGTLFEIADAQGDYSGSGEWQTLTWDITAGANSGDNNNVDQIVVFADWRCAEGQDPRPSNLTLLVDNITWGANKLTDPPAPSCINGIEDGDETGVDCGGSCPNDCIPDPPVSAPQAASTGSDLYVYSDISGPSVTNFIFTSFGGDGGTYTEIDIETNGNMTGKLLDLGFFGSQWDPVDASAYTYVHLDYFATTATSFNFFLIDDSLSETVCCGNPAEPFYGFGSTADEALVQGEWVSVFIPLSHFSNFNAGWDGTDLKQTKFTGNGTIYFDNIYFSTDNELSVKDFSTGLVNVYPNPTTDNWQLLGSVNPITKVELYNILGKRIDTQKFNSLNATFDGSALGSGIYFARVYYNNNYEVIRLVKK